MADRIGGAYEETAIRSSHRYDVTGMVQSSGAGYDVPVAGIDEASARSALAAMQDRLARDPAYALGVASNATADEVRAAFLQLTKQYHPVRFSRMMPDVQRLSNEVFLALRAAHDALVKAARRQSGPIAIARAPTPSALPMPLSMASPPMGVPVHHARPPQQVPVRPSRPVPPSDSGERLAMPSRTMTPPAGVRVPVSRPPGPPAVARPPSAVRQTGATPILGSRDEAVALDLLQRQQWDQARSVLHQLSARDPGSKRIRALMSYARGREAQLDRRFDDARVELQDALELDPDLQPAKTALTELFTRRK